LKERKKRRYEKEERLLWASIRKEKKKRDCLEKALKERDKEDERNRKSKEAENEINKIKLDVKKQVDMKRDDLKKRIEAIKKKHRRKRRILKQQLQKIRGQMAKSLIKANKFGEWRLCKNARGNKGKVAKYCDTNFIDNFAQNKQCKDPEDFCYICCENEYGNMYIKQRDTCYEMCDNMSKRDLANGVWKWKWDDPKKRRKNYNFKFY